MKTNESIIPQVLKNDPLNAAMLASGFVEMNRARWFDYYFGFGRSYVMPLISFKITPLCNLECKMCGQKGIHGTLKHDLAQKENEKLVPFDQYVKLTDDIAGITKIFYVWGGEPFLYPNFIDLATYMANKVLLTVNTNGTHLEANAERIVKDGWTGIFISLDGFEDVNDSIRGQGTYQRVMRGIEAINREKKKQNKTTPYMGIVTTISNMNYMYLDKLAAAMADKGLSWHIINLGTYYNEIIGQQQRDYFKKHLGIDAYYWRGFTSGCNEGIDGKKFSEILEKVHSYKNGYPIITVPTISPKKIGTYYNDLSAIVMDRCLAPWFSTNINYNGDVHFCADYPDYVVGNILQDNIVNIYNNKKAIKFRKALKRAPHGLFPACRRCYNLMLCGRKVADRRIPDDPTYGK